MNRDHSVFYPLWVCTTKHWSLNQFSQSLSLLIFCLFYVFDLLSPMLDLWIFTHNITGLLCKPCLFMRDVLRWLPVSQHILELSLGRSLGAS